MTQSIFISRAGADAAFAATIGAILEAAGHPVTLQQWDFGSRNFMEQMHAALDAGGLVLALLSTEYMRSEHCRAEVFSALAHDPLNNRGRVIVMRVTECTPMGLFAALAYCDLVPLHGNAAALRDVVLAAIKPVRERVAALAPYWRPARTVLHSRIQEVPAFTGRVEAMAAMDAALLGAGGGGMAVITQGAVVHGGGGIGKSALAQHYGWANRERYAGVWWLQADTTSGILDGLIALGAEFNPTLAEVQSREEAARAALAFIEGAGFAKPWLLIYDNVERPDALNGWTPRHGAQTLITTRWPDWRGRAVPVALDVFTPDEAAAFLLERTGRTDEAGARALAELLGWLPLALDHAAAFCVETGDSFTEYASRVDAWLALAPDSADYPAPVFATFKLAIEKAAAACAEAEKLLGILSFLAPDAIPRDIVTEDIMDAMALRRAVAALAKVSLVKVEAEGEGGPLLTVHRLVQRVMRARLAEADAAEHSRNPSDPIRNPRDPIRNPSDSIRNLSDSIRNPSGSIRNPRTPIRNPSDAVRNPSDAVRNPRTPIRNPRESGDPASKAQSPASVALRLVADAFPRGDGPNDPSDVRSWPTCKRLYPHALAVLDPFLPSPMGRRWREAPDEGLQSLDRPHPLTKNSSAPALLVGSDCQTSQQAPEARNSVLSPWERQTNASSEDASSAFIDLADKAALLLSQTGTYLYARADYAEAEPLMRRALAIDEKAYGPDHPEVATALNNLAQLLADTNRHAEAEPLMRRALAIDEKAYGPDHPEVATALNNLAQLLADTNRHAEAEPLMRRALAIDEKSYGPDHPEVATDLNNLAQLLKATNRLAEAEPLMRRVIAIFEKSYGPSHPNVATALNNLAQLLKATNRHAEAEPLMRRALAIDEKSYGPDHPEVATDLNNLAQLLKATNRLAEAEPLMRRALAIVEASLPDHHPWVQGARANLAALLAAMGAAPAPQPPAPPPPPPPPPAPPRRGLLARLLARPFFLSRGERAE